MVKLYINAKNSLVGLIQRLEKCQLGSQKTSKVYDSCE